jgi:hypothetical protein
VSTSQKGSIELVGEFFEVRAQVDRDLTTVSRVDRRLGLIKNLGHHNASSFGCMVFYVLSEVLKVFKLFWKILNDLERV